MFALKLPLTLPPPRRADRTRAPAAMAAVLAGMVVLQLALPRAVELPDGGAIPSLRLRAQQPNPVVNDRIILDRALFAPSRRNDIVVTQTATGTTASPLGGAIAVGLVNARGAVRVFVQAPDGAVRALVRGDTYLGWQLTSIGASGVVFTRGSQTLKMPLAASQPPVAKPATETPEEEEQP